MRPWTALAWSSLPVSALLLVGCGGAAESPTAGDRRATATVSDTTAPTCDDTCRAERRAERQAREAERCDTFLSQVRLSYRITTTPTTGGSEIRLWMTLANRTDSRLTGSTGGLMRIEPDPRRNQISWGGSSADELWQKPGSVVRREVWHDRQPPGWHPVGDRVTSFDFYTYVYAPGPGIVACQVPATIVADPQLVADHPDGRWRQQSDP